MAMTFDLAAVYALAGPALLVFTRIVALFAVSPLIGGMYVPFQAKALLAAAVTAVLLPAQIAAMPVSALDGWFALLVVKEAMVGLTIGWFIDLFFQGVRFGGDLANRHAGYSAAEYFDPETDAAASPIGDLFHIGAVMLFLLTDGHHLFFAALSRSYAVIPAGAWTLGPDLVPTLVAGVDELTRIALAISFPVLSTIMAITIAEGVIVRAVPQINMLHFSFAMKIMVSLLVLYAGMPAAVAFMAAALAGMQQATFALMPLMR
ncbi:MAG: flagellar biosynthetic protein FliR [Planctomycetes bacterium]|nr:flagellar biosynthetic protein FliR [Planctomycetota bacterium]